MSYGVEFTDTAEEDLSRLDRTIAQQVLNKLGRLANNVDSVRHKALVAQFSGAYSLRIGQYRVIYGLDRTEHNVVVHFVRHRSTVYSLR